jgi:hypothetical protein
VEGADVADGDDDEAARTTAVFGPLLRLAAPRRVTKPTTRTRTRVKALKLRPCRETTVMRRSV